MTTEQSDGACTPSFSSDGLGGDDLVATLRKFADIAEAGDKPHWAGAMRVAATEIRQLRDLLAEAVSLRPFWPFPLGDEIAKRREALWQRIESSLPPNAGVTGSGEKI